MCDDYQVGHLEDRKWLQQPLPTKYSLFEAQMSCIDTLKLYVFRLHKMVGLDA